MISLLQTLWVNGSDTQGAARCWDGVLQALGLVHQRPVSACCSACSVLIDLRVQLKLKGHLLIHCGSYPLCVELTWWWTSVR